MNLRRACEHGRWEKHVLFGLGGSTAGDCSGGTEPTTAELLAMLVEEGVLSRKSFHECHRCDADVPAVHEPDYYEASVWYESEPFKPQEVTP